MVIDKHIQIIIESWNANRLQWTDLKYHLVPTSPVMGRDTFPCTRLFKALSILAVNTARAGASTSSLGYLFQCLTTLTVKIAS